MFRVFCQDSHLLYDELQARRLGFPIARTTVSDCLRPRAVLAWPIEPLSCVGYVRNDFRTVFVQIPFLKNGLKTS